MAVDSSKLLMVTNHVCLGTLSGGLFIEFNLFIAAPLKLLLFLLRILKLLFKEAHRYLERKYGLFCFFNVCKK